MGTRGGDGYRPSATARGEALRYAAILAGAYLAVGSAWILVSSTVVSRLASGLGEAHGLEVAKGWGFIVVTSVMLFFLTRTLLRRAARHVEALQRSREALAVLEQRAYIGRVAATVAHDCNNVATILSADLDELSRLQLTPAARRLVDEAVGANERMIALFQNLMAAARERPLGDRVEVDLREEVDRAAQLLRAHPRLARCEVEVEAAEPVRCAVYATLVERAVLNLALNACDAMRGEGVVRISVRAEQGLASIAVDDAGPGVPEELRARIFEPSFTTKTTGHGLGLLSVRICAEAHEGSVDVAPSPQGGARFVLRLPC